MNESSCTERTPKQVQVHASLRCRAKRLTEQGILPSVDVGFLGGKAAELSSARVLELHAGGLRKLLAPLERRCSQRGKGKGERRDIKEEGSSEKMTKSGIKHAAHHLRLKRSCRCAMCRNGPSWSQTGKKKKKLTRVHTHTRQRARSPSLPSLRLSLSLSRLPYVQRQHQLQRPRPSSSPWGSCPVAS